MNQSKALSGSLLLLCMFTCDMLGLAGNPTLMACRSLAGEELSLDSPYGFCLDSTSCSGIQRTPAPGP